MDLFIGTLALAAFGVMLTIRNGWRSVQAYGVVAGIVALTLLVTFLGGRFEEGVIALVIAVLAGWFIPDIASGTATATSRLVRRIAPWAIGATMVVGMIKFMPEVVGPLVGIAFCFVALRVMVRGLLPGGKKK